MSESRQWPPPLGRTDAALLLVPIAVVGLWLSGRAPPAAPLAWAAAGAATAAVVLRRRPALVPLPVPDQPPSTTLPPGESPDDATRQASKMEAVGRLAGGIAHDFNNILTVINGCSEVLLLDPGLTSQQRELLDEIRRAGDRGASLTRQLADFSRKKPVEPKVVDVCELVAALETMLHRLVREDIGVVLKLYPAPLPVKVDPGQIEQVVMNLVINARDAMPAGGTVTVSTECVAGNGEPYVVLKVKDTGVGMDEATRARIFEPFFTTKEIGKGTGLGLATVYSIVQQNGGRIDVSSAPGRGATFRVRLPIAPAARGSVADAPAKGPGSAGPGTETVLVVEDEGSVRSMVRRALTAAGYSVIEAQDGVEALVRSQMHRGPIDVVLTDVVMPHLGGAELVPILKRRHPRMRTIFMSGYTQSVVATQGIDEDAPCIVKPFTADEVVRSVRALLDGAPASEHVSRN